MPAWRPPDHLVEAAPERRGTIEELVVEGASRPGSRVAVRVYVPSGAGKGRPPLALALVLDGDNAREKGLLPRSLDNLIPSRVAPVLAAFVSRPEWGEKPPPEEEIEDAAANLLAHDVVPFLERRYGTDSSPEKRALVGTGFAAWRAAYAAFRHPKVFGALGLQSLSMLDTDQDLLEKQVPIRRGRPPADLPRLGALRSPRHPRGLGHAPGQPALRRVPPGARLLSRGRRGARGRRVGGLAQPHRPGVRGPVSGAARRGCESRAALTRYRLFSSTFDRRPLASYFARRAGGRSSGVPSTKPPFAWK